MYDKFPATAWLLGGDLMAAVASHFVREHPPLAPCIAEWGSEFPAFIATRRELESLPYVGSFATLEWALGKVSIATDCDALAWADVIAAGTNQLLDAVLTLQPGIVHLRATHNVDELIYLYLKDESPDRFTLRATETPIEVIGCRGKYRFERLDPDSYAFRSAIAAGAAISDAAGRAIEVNPEFDAGRAIQQMVTAGLVTSIGIHPQEKR